MAVSYDNGGGGGGSPATPTKPRPVSYKPRNNMQDQFNAARDRARLSRAPFNPLQTMTDALNRGAPTFWQGVGNAARGFGNWYNPVMTNAYNPAGSTTGYSQADLNAAGAAMMGAIRDGPMTPWQRQAANNAYAQRMQSQAQSFANNYRNPYGQGYVYNGTNYRPPSTGYQNPYGQGYQVNNIPVGRTALPPDFYQTGPRGRVDPSADLKDWIDYSTQPEERWSPNAPGRGGGGGGGGGYGGYGYGGRGGGGGGGGGGYGGNTPSWYMQLGMWRV